MNFTLQDIALLAIAAGVWCLFLFGSNVAG